MDYCQREKKIFFKFFKTAAEAEIIVILTNDNSHLQSCLMVGWRCCYFFSWLSVCHHFSLSFATSVLHIFFTWLARPLHQGRLKMVQLSVMNASWITQKGLYPKTQNFMLNLNALKWALKVLSHRQSKWTGTTSALKKQIFILLIDSIVLGLNPFLKF